MILIYLCALWLTANSYQTMQLEVRVKVKDEGRQDTNSDWISLYEEQPLTNYKNTQYYTWSQVGTPGQSVSMLLDTGSTEPWVPVTGCKGCPATNNLFRPSASSTYTNLQKRGSIQYGKGAVAGIYGNDIFRYENMSVMQEILFVDQEVETLGTIPDGIVGLSNDKRIPNFLDLAYEQGQIVSPVFGFSLGLGDVGKPSHFYYNITDEQFSNATYIRATRSNYWTISVKKLQVDQQSYHSVREAVIDTGTSLITVPDILYAQLDQKFFSSFCSDYSKIFMRKCSCSMAGYPNITLMSSGISFNITPDMYIIQMGGIFGACYLGIDKLNMPFMILGDRFLQQNTVIFNKDKNSMGFIDNYQALTMLMPSLTPVYVLDFLEIGLLAAIGLLFYSRYRSPSKPEQTQYQMFNH